jgi:large subunit ribosomal protein L28
MKSKMRQLAIRKAKLVERGCFVTGVRVLFGHNVSKSNAKTQKIFKANISKKKYISDTLGTVYLKISRRGERTVEKYGGIDCFLRDYKKRKMTLSAMKMKTAFDKVKRSNATPEIAQH